MSHTRRHWREEPGPRRPVKKVQKNIDKYPKQLYTEAFTVLDYNTEDRDEYYEQHELDDIGDAR